MPIPTEPIGSIPRPPQLLSAMVDHSAGEISDEQLHAVQGEALRETIARLEETGSPVIVTRDGEYKREPGGDTNMEDDYRTRSRSCSTIARMSRFSKTGPPGSPGFACDDIHHDPRQVVGPNYLIREEQPKHGIDRA